MFRLVLSFPGSVFFTRGDCKSKSKAAWWLGSREIPADAPSEGRRLIPRNPRLYPETRNPARHNPGNGRPPLVYRLVIAPAFGVVLTLACRAVMALAFGVGLTQAPRSDGSRLRRGLTRAPCWYDSRLRRWVYAGPAAIALAFGGG